MPVLNYIIIFVFLDIESFYCSFDVLSHARKQRVITVTNNANIMLTDVTEESFSEPKLSSVELLVGALAVEGEGLPPFAKGEGLLTISLQQSEAAQVPVAQVPVSTSLSWLVPATHEEKSAHVGFASQQSDTAQVPVAQLPVSTSLRWLVPSTHEEKSAPLPSMSSHVGFASQQSDTAQVPVAQVPVSTSLR